MFRGILDYDQRVAFGNSHSRFIPPAAIKSQVILLAAGIQIQVVINVVLRAESPELPGEYWQMYGFRYTELEQNYPTLKILLG